MKRVVHIIGKVVILSVFVNSKRRLEYIFLKLVYLRFKTAMEEGFLHPLGWNRSRVSEAEFFKYCQIACYMVDNFKLWIQRSTGFDLESLVSAPAVL